MEFLGGAVALLSVVLGYQAFKNGRLIKEGINALKEAVIEMEKMAEERHREAAEWHKEIERAAQERHQEALKILDKISDLIFAVKGER